MLTEKFKQAIQRYLFIISFAGILFLPFIGDVDLFDWDEINFAEAAREMIQTGDYLTVRIDFEPFHEKPPLYIWLQVISMKIFGVNEFAARLPNALIGIITLIVLFKIGKYLVDEKFGFLFILAYSGSILPHFYFKTGLIDPLFNLLMFLSIYYLFRYFQEFSQKSHHFDKFYNYLLIASLFDGLAILTKGPVGYLLVVLTAFIFWFINRKVIRFPIWEFIIFTAIAFLPMLLWELALSMKYGFYLFFEFINYQFRLFSTQDAGHGGPIYYHLVVLLFGVFPASVFAFRGFRKLPQETDSVKVFSNWMLLLLIIVVSIFSIVNTKIVHYSSLAYFPLTFFAAKGIYSIMYLSTGWKKSTSWLLGLIGIPIAILSIIFPIIVMNIKLFLPKITDKFTYQILAGAYSWDGNEWLPGAILLIGIVVSLILSNSRKYLLSIITLFGSTTIFIVLLLPLLVPKIEQYTQLTPINFIKGLKDQNCYVQTYGYKSFAHYFYLDKKINQSAIYHKINSTEFENWLLTGEIDKTAFFIAKYPNLEKLESYPQLKKLYIKNGWIFFYRNP